MNKEIGLNFCKKCFCMTKTMMDKYGKTYCGKCKSQMIVKRRTSHNKHTNVGGEDEDN